MTKKKEMKEEVKVLKSTRPTSGFSPKEAMPSLTKIEEMKKDLIPYSKKLRKSLTQQEINGLNLIDIDELECYVSERFKIRSDIDTYRYECNRGCYSDDYNYLNEKELVWECISSYLKLSLPTIITDEFIYDNNKDPFNEGEIYDPEEEVYGSIKYEQLLIEIHEVITPYLKEKTEDVPMYYSIDDTKVSDLDYDVEPLL